MVTENFWMSSCRSMSSWALIAGCWLRRAQTLSTISCCARRLWSAAASTLGSLTLDAADRTSEASSSSCTNSSTCWAWAGSRLWARWAAKAPDRPLVPATAQPPRAPPCWVQAPWPQGCNGKDRKEPKAIRSRNNDGVNMEWVSLNLNCWRGPWLIRLNSRSRLACKGKVWLCSRRQWLGLGMEQWVDNWTAGLI